MAGLFDFAQPQPQPSPGLLGQDFNDPKSAAIMNLAGAMIRGDFGGGLIGANKAYQDTQNQLLQRADVAQQIGLRNIQLQQAMQQWKMMQPILQQVSSQLTGGAPAAAAAPAQPAIAPTTGGALGSGTFGIPVGGQDQSVPAQPAAQGGSSVMGLPRSVAMTALAFGGPGKFAEAVSKYNEPTDLIKTMRAAGIQEGSPLWNQTLQGNIAKGNYIAPVNARPGSIIRDPMDPQHVLAFNPHVPEGSAPQFDANGNVVAYQPIGNAEQALAMPERARKTGANQVTPSIVYGPDGTPRFSTVAQDVQRAAPSAPQPEAALPPAQPGVNGAFVGDPAAVAAAIAGIKDPQERANAQAAFEGQMRATGGNLPPAGGVTPVLKPGAAQGAQLSQDELSKKGSSLMADNGQTNTVISRLQNIKMLAPGAITGAETGRRDFLNGLLSLAGIPAATDAKTASDLVDKNAAQITSALRMGQGGAGTDALQTLINAANPNRHMTPDAINEAVDQLVASQQMIQSKAKLLQPSYLARDPVAYGQRELQFDQNADPRVWQLQAMPQDQRAKYVKTLPPAVAADMLKKYQALKQIGAFQ